MVDFCLQNGCAKSLSGSISFHSDSVVDSYTELNLMTRQSSTASSSETFVTCLTHPYSNPSIADLDCKVLERTRQHLYVNPFWCDTTSSSCMWSSYVQNNHVQNTEPVEQIVPTFCIEDVEKGLTYILQSERATCNNGPGQLIHCNNSERVFTNKTENIFCQPQTVALIQSLNQPLATYPHSLHATSFPLMPMQYSSASFSQNCMKEQPPVSAMQLVDLDGFLFDGQKTMLQTESTFHSQSVYKVDPSTLKKSCLLKRSSFKKHKSLSIEKQTSPWFSAIRHRRYSSSDNLNSGHGISKRSKHTFCKLLSLASRFHSSTSSNRTKANYQLFCNVSSGIFSVI